MQQITLQNSISLKGIGVHSGRLVNLTIKPAEEDTGIIFIRTDIADKQKRIIPAKYDLVKDTKLSTMLINDYGIAVGTVEHLMSALSIFLIDNAIIEVDSEEVPILDGSSKIYVEEIQNAGLKFLGDNKRILRIVKPVEVITDKWAVRIVPNEDFIINININFDNKVISKQSYRFNCDKESYEESIADARTFGQLHEIQYLNSIGLALGGSLENAVVVDNEKVLNPDGLRYKDEFVRHKILDAIGDLYMAGYRIKGEFFGEKSGHEANNMLLRAIFKDPSCYEIEDIYTNYSVVPFVVNSKNYISAK